MTQAASSHTRSSQQSTFAKTLPERLDASFTVLVELRDLLRQARIKQGIAPPATDPKKELIEHLYGVVAAIERCCEIKPESAQTPLVDLAALARALLTAQKGERFEPCVQQLIRDYRMAYDNVRRYQQSTLPEPYQADVVARFRQQLDCAEQSLHLLKVSAFEPCCGEKLSPSKHRVVKVLSCDSSEIAETVAQVISPGFEWANDQGDRRTQPAEVVAYGEFVPKPQAENEQQRRFAETAPRRVGTDREVKSLAGKRLKGEK